MCNFVKVTVIFILGGGNKGSNPEFIPDHVPRLKGTLDPAEWEAKKQKWRAVLLSVPCSFCVVAAADVWKSAFNRRQAVLQEHESLSRTAIQSAMEIFHLKSLVENATNKTKMSAQSLSAELLKLGLQQVVGGSAKTAEDDDSEAGSLTPGFIAQALNVHKNVMSQPRVVELLMELETRYGTRSCFHKMSKLAVLASKPSSAKTRVWILEFLVDWLDHNVLKVSDISKSVLQGDRTHCGLVALFETKLNATWQIEKILRGISFKIWKVLFKYRILTY